MRTTRRAALAALLLVTAACGSGDGEVALAINDPSEGSTVGGNVVFLALDGSGIQIVPADGDTSGETGHFHVFIDREPVAAGESIPVERGIVHSAENPVRVTGLDAGEHTLTVVYGNGSHQRIGTTQASVTVTTEGPSVKASATVEGSTITVDAQVEDLELVVDPPSPEHLHYFLDTTPTPEGSPIPTDDPTIIHSRETTVTFEDVQAGEHVIAVVAGDAQHIPLDPPVMDVIKVTVTT